MISLDDPAWNASRRAYGSASDIPNLLRRLALSPGPSSAHEEEPWFSLWSSLCHQGDVYEASYLALPHVVVIALEADGPIDFSFLLLPTSVEVARRTGHGPDVPAAHAEAYCGAIARLPEVVGRHMHRAWDRSWLRSAVSALAIAKGHVAEAQALLELDDDWIAMIVADERD